MSDQFIGEIRIYSFDFAPQNWAQCNGQLMAINQNQALFSLLGTYYGGNGTTTFALPDLRGCTPIHWGNSFNLGSRGGASLHQLIQTQMPTHTHAVRASNTRANLLSPDNAILGLTAQPAFSDGTPGAIYETASTTLASTSSTGGNQAHTNMQPYLGLNICIALQGIFPSRN